MKVTFDPVKRLVTLQERGIDFATDAEKVFAGDTATMVGKRFGYGEVRDHRRLVERSHGDDGLDPKG